MADLTFTPQSFADSLLSGIGAPVTPGNEAFILNWERQEGGNWSNKAAYNPLNTTQKEPGSYNAVGNVQGYPDAATGIAASVKTLGYSFYTGIVSALRGNNPTGAAQALVASPWAGSHYGGDWQKFLAGVPAGTPATPAPSGGSPLAGVLNFRPTLPAGTSTTSPPLTGTGVSAPDITQTALVTGTESEKASKSAPRILASLDKTLNLKGGVLSGLNPVSDARVIVARGGVILVGIIMGVAGLVLLVDSIGPKVVDVTSKASQAGAKVAEVAAVA